MHRLSNGVRVVCDPMPGLQTVALSVVAGRGARAEDAARSGWSHLLEHMVFKGTPTFPDVPKALQSITISSGLTGRICNVVKLFAKPRSCIGIT